MFVFDRVFVKHKAGDPIAILELLVSKFGRTIICKHVERSLGPAVVFTTPLRIGTIGFNSVQKNNDDYRI